MNPASPDDYLMLLRRLTWDALPCGEQRKFMAPLGLVPTSDEGADMEHADSHKRLKLQEPLQDQLRPYSRMSAKVLAAHALKLDLSPEPAELMNLVISQFAETIHLGASVIIANLLDQGYLQLGPKVRVPANA